MLDVQHGAMAEELQAARLQKRIGHLQDNLHLWRLYSYDWLIACHVDEAPPQK